MSSRLFFALATLGLFTLAQAQSVPVPSTVQTGGSLSVTGCLQRSAATSEYTLTSSEGKRYDLRTNNSEIKFTDHVGHKVTVTGAQASRTPNTNPGTTTTEQQGSLDVIALVMVSQTCQP